MQSGFGWSRASHLKAPSALKTPSQVWEQSLKTTDEAEFLPSINEQVRCWSLGEVSFSS